MPLYHYRCCACDDVFEELVPTSRADEPVPCPSCGAEKTERELTTFAVRGDGIRREAEPFCGRCGENRPPCAS
ncbi:MAG: FmdB family zinc ribbon protein [Planctomycetota bacterium]